MKKINLKKINTTVENLDGYITNISDIYGKLKNITVCGKITDIKKLEKDNHIFVFLTLKDNSGSIICLLIGNREDIKLILKDININDIYRVNGNVNILSDNDEITEFTNLFSDNSILDYIINKKILAVKEIEKVKIV